jgi:hypothetical protein
LAAETLFTAAPAADVCGELMSREVADEVKGTPQQSRAGSEKYVE